MLGFLHRSHLDHRLLLHLEVHIRCHGHLDHRLLLHLEVHIRCHGHLDHRLLLDRSLDRLDGGRNCFLHHSHLFVRYSHLVDHYLDLVDHLGRSRSIPSLLHIFDDFHLLSPSLGFPVPV